MKSLRFLNNGKRHKALVLMAARKLLLTTLEAQFGKVPLGKSASFLNGTSYDVTQVSGSSGIPIVRISNISDPSSTYLQTSERLDPRFLVYEGDLLVSWSASFKSIIWPGPEGYLNQHIFKVTENEGFNRRYIRHAIEASFGEMQANVVGIGMMHLRRSDFLAQQIPAPTLNIQLAVADFLDHVELSRPGHLPHLPTFLSKQAHVVERIEELAAQVEEARALRAKAIEEVQSLCESIIMTDQQAKLTPLHDLVRLREPDIIVKADESYQFAGVYCFGRGVFYGQARTGLEFAYKKLTRLHVGNFVYPKLMAWEGAFGVVPRECDGCYVSTEFPVFEVLEDKVLPEVLDAYFRMPAVWPQIAGSSTGTNVRRRRLNPADFLAHQIRLPSLDAQRRLRAVGAHANQLKTLQEETGKQLDALMPSILDKAFKGEL